MEPVKIKIAYTPSEKQCRFHSSGADEIVYGGAKGGGKSCALVMETLAYCLENAGAVAYLFRETYDDLEANLIREWKDKVPRSLYKYSESKHIVTMINGSEVFFRYIQNETDAKGYQGRSIDFIGVDELTKHTEGAIQELLSCLRSPKGFKARFCGTCNPGGVGHTWVKERYIVPTNYGAIQTVDAVTGNSIAFIPAKVYDNPAIMKNDPAYVRRLENLPPNEKEAYLHGNWDIFEGQYFSEWKRDIHVIDPFPIPAHWRWYFTMDYGLDMAAFYWIAVDEQLNAYVVREFCQGKDHPDDRKRAPLIIDNAAKAILSHTQERLHAHLAPTDLWNSRQESGKSMADLFAEHGIYLTKTSRDRLAGWMAVKEWLKPYEDVDGRTRARLSVFSNCTELIRCMPLLQYDDKKPSDAAIKPHEITHAPDAIRGFCVYWTSKARVPAEEPEDWGEKRKPSMLPGRASRGFLRL